MKRSRPPTRVFGLLWLALGLGAVGGCSQVAPYQREKLAHPTMLLSDVSGPGASHVYAIQEGAVGGGTAVEGGCGCN